jgi:hypothetical protein
VEKNLQVVRLELKRLRVTQFSSLDNTMSFAVLFNDGVDKELSWNSSISDPKSMAKRLLLELIAAGENEHIDFDGEKLISDAEILVDDSMKLEGNLINFFQGLCSKAARIKNSSSSEGYLKMISDLRMSQLTL